MSFLKRLANQKAKWDGWHEATFEELSESYDPLQGKESMLRTNEDGTATLMVKTYKRPENPPFQIAFEDSDDDPA